MAKRDYDDPVYKEIRLRCLKRDKRRCKMPGCSSKRRLEVHHISRYSDSPHLRFELTNCIVLCHECHLSIKNKETHYESLFRSIINGYP